MAGDKETIGSVLRRLYKKLSAKRRKQLLVVFFMMLLGAVAEVMTLGAVLPFLALMADPGLAEDYPKLQSIFAFFGWTEPDDLLVPVALMFGLVALLAGAVRVGLSWSTNTFTFRLGHELGVDVYRRMLHQPYSYHTERNTSEIVAAIAKVQMVTQGVILPLMQSFIAMTIGLFIIVALMIVAPYVSLAAFAGFGVVYFGISMLTRRRLQRNSETILRAHSRRVQAVQEGLGGIRDVLIDSSQEVFLRKFAQLDWEIREAQAMNGFIGASPRFAIESAGMLLFALLALILSKGEAGLSGALPVLGALALGAQRLLPLMQHVYVGRTQIAATWDVMGEVIRLLGVEIPEEQLTQAGQGSLVYSKALRLDDVVFRHKAEFEPVLNGVSLEIPRGSRIGFIGKTGSGKSTIMDLVMGLLEPSSGTISVDGQVLDAKARRLWQKQVAHVPQAIFLSDGTIAENIAFGIEVEDIELEQVERAAAQLSSFVDTLAEGYDTVIGERGVRLSGGQRQRIGIARALYKNASLLVFDEATSALDGETEESVMKAIAGLDRDLTLLIVAHRLSTVSLCDRVVRLEAGHIVEIGDFESVVGSAGG